jgi:archaetidylinositol phosphate synthase
MTFEKLRPFSKKIVGPVINVLEHKNITPNQISFIGFFIAVMAAVAFYFGEKWYVAGAALIFFSGVMDLLDGELARRRETESSQGDLIDHVLDRYSDMMVIGGLAIGIEQYLIGFVAMSGAFMTSYVGTQIQAVGFDRTYSGILVRADRFILIFIAIIINEILGPIGPYNLIVLLLVVIGIVGHLTALQRFFGVWREKEGVA